jgi:lipoprotein signal peptidase
MVAAIIVIPVSAGMHTYITHLDSPTLGDGFISIYVTKNPGVAFSIGDTLGVGGIYAIQVMVSLIILGIVAFTHK